MGIIILRDLISSSKLVKCVIFNYDSYDFRSRNKINQFCDSLSPGRTQSKCTHGNDMGLLPGIQHKSCLKLLQNVHGLKDEGCDDNVVVRRLKVNTRN